MEVVGRGRRGIWPERAKDWLDIANIRRALRTRVALRVLGTTPKVQPPASSHPPDTPADGRRGFCFVMLGKLRTCRIGNGLSCLDCRFYYLSHWRLASVGPHGCCIGGGSRSKAVSVGGEKTARRDPAKSAVSRLTRPLTSPADFPPILCLCSGQCHRRPWCPPAGRSASPSRRPRYGRTRSCRHRPRPE